jgi:3-deoxy-D-manno-octulosonate 8-phosphate phosphatase (KDO 8-P phosphatase)
MKSETNPNTIKLVLFDLDGVLIQENRNFTLDQILIPLKKFVEDIYDRGIQFAIVSGRHNDEVTNFLEVYKIRMITSSLNKVSDAEKIIDDLGIEFNEVFFMGDDILDIPLLQKVGYSAAPRNARREVKRVAKKIIPAEDVEFMLNEIKKIVLQNLN